MLETLYLDGDFPLKKVNDLALILPIKSSIKIRFMSTIKEANVLLFYLHKEHKNIKVLCIKIGNTESEILPKPHYVLNNYISAFA